MENLKKVLQRIRWARLELSPEKCILFQSKVTYLGYIVNENGVKVDARKLEAVAEWPIPRNMTEVKRFLGLASQGLGDSLLILLKSQSRSTS